MIFYSLLNPIRVFVAPFHLNLFKFLWNCSVLHVSDSGLVEHSIAHTCDSLSLFKQLRQNMARMRWTIRKRTIARARARREVVARRRVRRLVPVTLVFTFIIIIVVGTFRLIVVVIY